MKKSERLIYLLEFLKKGGKVSLEDIAAACGNSERTVYRDIRLLTKLGFPIKFDDGFHLDRIWQLHEFNKLSDSDLRLVKFALETHPLGTLFPFADLAARLDIAKVPVGPRINLSAESDFTLAKMQTPRHGGLDKTRSRTTAGWTRLVGVVTDKNEPKP